MDIGEHRTTVYKDVQFIFPKNTCNKHVYFFLAVFVMHLTHEVHDIDATKKESQN